MARLKASCTTCRVDVPSLAAHMATATHRAKVAVANDRRHGNVIESEERAAWARKMHAGSRAAEERYLEELAMQGDADHEPYWLGVLIEAGLALPADPGDGTRLGELAPADPAPAAAAPAALEPCPRCSRSDWQTAKGRDWHLANNPDCARWRNPAKHAYTVAA